MIAIVHSIYSQSVHAPARDTGLMDNDAERYCTDQSKFWMDKTKGLSPNHVFVQKSRWPYSMQSKFGMDKIQGNYKLVWLYEYMASGYIFTSSKKVMDYL